MAEGAEKKVRVTINAASLLKIAAAISALAAAINGYVQIRQDQNNMLQVISDKVEAIVLKVAYLEGRVDGLSPKEARKEAERRVTEASAPAVTVAVPFTVTPPTPGRLPSVPPEVPPAAAEPEMVKTDKALFRQMPRDLDAVQMLVEQKIMEIEKPAAAAPPEVAP